MGAISPFAIEEFIEQPRDNHLWMKKVPRLELSREVAKLNYSSTSIRPMLAHQLACFLLGARFKKFAFHLDMGTGKTRLALELIRYWVQRKRINVTLVLVPSESAIISWENQIKEWRIDVPYVSLTGSSSAVKWEKLDGFKSGIILVTYAGLSWMVSKKKETEKFKKGQVVSVGKLLPHEPFMNKLISLVDAIVADESTELGNGGQRGSLIWRLCNRLANHVQVFYQLAGIPFGRDPTMLWSQLYLIDRGASLGDTLTMFRSAFFDVNENYWGGYEYKFRKSMEPVLKRMVGHRSINYACKECIDLPKLVEVLEEVALPTEAVSYYESYLAAIKKRHASYSERKNSFIRMRQVSSGFVGFTDDDTGDKAEIAFLENPKLDRLIELIKEVPPDRKFVVFHEFTMSGELICKALHEAKINHVRLWGKTKDHRTVQEKFDNDPNCRGMVANHKVGGYGLNLQRANYVFFYESPVSVVDRKQAERRVYRQGQTETVWQYDLCCKGTVDARILAFHRMGADLFKAIMTDPDTALHGQGELALHGKHGQGSPGTGKPNGQGTGRPRPVRAVPTLSDDADRPVRQGRARPIRVRPS